MILVREVSVPAAAGVTVNVKFEVGPVERVDTEEWECACAVAVGSRRVALRVAGIDSLQATILAVRLLRSEANSLLRVHPATPTHGFGPTLLLTRRKSPKLV